MTDRAANTAGDLGEILQARFSYSQFLFLSLLFLVPAVSGEFIPLFGKDELSLILTLEFTAIVVGFFLFGFAWMPFLVSTHPAVRYVVVVLVLLLSYPLSAGVRDEHGWVGFIAFYYLIFATYCGTFLGREEHLDRIRLVGELALRWLVYMVLFLGLGAMVPTIYVERITNYEEGFVFGAAYFGSLALIEWRRYMPRAVYLVEALLRRQYHRRPPEPKQDRAGRWRSVAATRNESHGWPMFLGIGVVLVAMVSVFFYASFEVESWLGRIAFWLFLLPFAVIGPIMCWGGLVIMFRMLTAPGPWLNLREHIQLGDSKLLADGHVPLYARGIERQSVDAALFALSARVLDPYGDNWEVKEDLVYQVREGELNWRSDAAGTRFQLEVKLPDRLKDQRWHLRITLQDKQASSDNVQQWAIDFPLPGGDLKARPAA